MIDVRVLALKLRDGQHVGDLIIASAVAALFVAAALVATIFTLPR